jgi:hypothetical protein
VRVLLVGRGIEGSSVLWKHLTKKECQIQCASSVEQGLTLLEMESFDVVLVPMNTDTGHRAHLIENLLNSSSYLFYSLPVEDGTWWIPVIDSGKHCLGAPAVHSGDFVSVLDELLLERRSVLERQAVNAF